DRLEPGPTQFGDNGPGLPVHDSIQRVLVTGAAGFIGRAVVAELRRAGLEPVTLDRDVTPPYASVDQPIPIDVVADLATADLDAALSEVDAVVHLAGTPGVQSSWAEGFETHVRNNLVATQRVCEAALRTDCQRVVVASSSSVYGDVERDLAREDDHLTPLSPYGASKAAVEHLLGAYAARGLSIAAMRYFTVFGPGQRPDMAINRLFRATVDGPAFPLRGTGEQCRSFTYVDDVAEATVRAVRRMGTSSVFNVGGGEVVSVRDLIKRIEALTGRTIRIEQLPPAPGDPGRTAADVTRAATELGWSATTSIDDGLAAQWHWHQRSATSPSTAPAYAT
ncbi:MAG: SDR family NAD(P)-dependent oxidoreductase, partial [Actinomycetota bacterium]